MFFGKKMVDIYHELLSLYVKEGDTVVDATAGNGFDTEYLCRLVGDRGLVHAFDIQQQACEHTMERLSAAGLYHRCQMHLASHERMDEFVQTPVAAFCFNLGYLPEGDQGIITEASTTIVAVKKALEALKCGGLGCILSYYGHEGGQKEQKFVDELLKALPAKKYEVFRLENHNRLHQPPILYLIKKLK